MFLRSTSLLFLAALVQAAPPTGYNARVTVTAPTRIDWTFAVANQSTLTPPANWLGEGYDSKKQTYELFVPTGKDAKTPLPAVLFISAGNEPQGWKAFEAACKQQGMVFIGVREAGNNVALPKRIRMILDAFDDVRRQVPLDPDRTYISGFSGGGRVACMIGFALPEYFGGIAPLAAGGERREETWLQQRAADRLSIALATGETDFNRGEVERWKGPFFSAVGIRTKVWTVPKGGHAIPPDKTVTEMLTWLDEAKTKRADLAKKFPAMRAVAEPNRDAFAKALAAEGRNRLQNKDDLYRGLMLLKGVFTRYPDLAVGKEALKTLEEYDAKKDRPWDAEDIRDLQRSMLAEARTLGDYALNGIPPGSQYAKQRPDMAKRVLSLWEQLIRHAPDSDDAKEGKKLIPQLEKLRDAK